ncbi:hypothetical protein PSMK_24460 [Phycisphaera mikurensis NBRC 102666]|uniref:Uncharacterized protein n=1 Tax=Phycisphaera mikurensis (strain NBRC 102666 / KCTC 22515 / FYK2301M01) TaxID=1142394 RepID=I0IH67_PHYMF|nr:hypothetical protein PSMK_24460 [Phycisphaera mikurensis NBRC 102666]
MSHHDRPEERTAADDAVFCCAAVVPAPLAPATPVPVGRCDAPASAGRGWRPQRGTGSASARTPDRPNRRQPQAV